MSNEISDAIKPIIFPIIRKLIPNLIASSITGVQPMNISPPSRRDIFNDTFNVRTSKLRDSYTPGSIFTIRPKYT